MRNKLLNRIAELAWRRPVLVILLALSLAAVGAVYASKALTLNANTDDLIASDRPFMIQYRQFLKEFGDLEYIYAVVQKKGGGKATPQNDDVIREAVDALTERLRRIPGLPGVYSSIHPSEQLRIATRAMPERELADLAKAAVAFPALLSGRTDRVINDAILLIKRLIGEGHKLSEQEQEKLGSAAIFLLKCIAASKPDSPSHNDMALLLGATQQREYFKSESGQLYFITIMPVKDYSTLSVIQEPLDKIRAAIDQVQGQYPEVEIGLTGKPVLQADEMATTNTDMTLASLLGVGLVSALFMISFGGIWRPLMAVIAFACGAAWTYGAATLLVGRLNLLSIVFMLVLVGVGLDYGIHVISRYRENRRRPMDVHESLVSAVRTAVRGNLTGALTSSAVFFTAWLTTFQGLRELGLIAGIGLLLCMFAMATVLPSLIALFDRRRFRTELEIPPGREFVPRSIEDRNWLVKRSTWVLGAAAIVTVSMIAVPGKLRFERNLLKLQASGLDSVKWEHRVIEDSASASWFGAAIAESQDHALLLIDRAKRQPTIGNVRSVFDIIQPQTQRRQELRAGLQSGVPPEISLMDLDTSPASGAMDTPDAWRVADLHEAIGPLGLIASGAAKDAPEVAAELRQIREDLQSLVAEIERDPDARQRVNQTIQRIGESLFMMLRGDLLDLRFALPDALREEYVSPKGRYLVMMHPKENVWEYEPMKRFIADLRAVDPNVTGAPITHFESLGEMQRAFLQMAIYALLVIAAIVLLDFRKLRFMILTVIPTLVGLAWLVELMALLGISFNLANFFAVPILIGLSVDGTVHILHRYAEGGPTRFSLGATRRAVIVTAMTTMIGFGGLMLAHHRGLHSLGQVMVIGTACCLIATIVLLPVLLAWLERHKGLNDVGQSKGVFAKPPVRADAPTPRRRIAAADVRR